MHVIHLGTNKHYAVYLAYRESHLRQTVRVGASVIVFGEGLQEVGHSYKCE